MGQKTHPVGFRLGVIKTWDSNWYDEKGFAAKLNEDVMIRNYVRNRLKKAGISKIQIERTPKNARITIHTSRPGIVIGKSGDMIKKISSTARHSIELMSDRQVFLELRVKVSPNWRDDANALKWLGYVKEKK